MLHPSSFFNISQYDISGYVGLKPHPEYDFFNGDKVKYNSFDLNDKPYTQFSILAYYPPVGAFVLINYSDGNFTDLLIEGEGITRVDLLHDIGIELLEKIV